MTLHMLIPCGEGIEEGDSVSAASEVCRTVTPNQPIVQLLSENPSYDLTETRLEGNKLHFISYRLIRSHNQYRLVIWYVASTIESEEE